ncbi:hypothetical protein HMPREF1249_0738 [Jonquetella sp. BV3C21]|nr:hypothetical protein HMPREF1249_0738 [Jonquetella sp. BV3C21]
MRARSAFLSPANWGMFVSFGMVRPSGDRQIFLIVQPRVFLCREAAGFAEASMNRKAEGKGKDRASLLLLEIGK